VPVPESNFSFVRGGVDSVSGPADDAGLIAVHDHSRNPLPQVLNAGIHILTAQHMSSIPLSGSTGRTSTAISVTPII
jgi:hypothetical protein